MEMNPAIEGTLLDDGVISRDVYWHILLFVKHEKRWNLKEVF